MLYCESIIKGKDEIILNMKKKLNFQNREIERFRFYFSVCVCVCVKQPTNCLELNFRIGFNSKFFFLFVLFKGEIFYSAPVKIKTKDFFKKKKKKI